MNLNRTVFTIEKQQNLIKSNLDLITRKMDRSDDEINFLLKYVNNQGTGKNQYFVQNISLFITIFDDLISIHDLRCH